MHNYPSHYLVGLLTLLTLISILHAEYCAENEKVLNYTQQAGIEVTDESGNDTSGVLKGSPQVYVSFVPGPMTTVIIKETQPGNNTLMEILPFSVINVEKVKVTIKGPNDAIYVSEVSINIARVRNRVETNVCCHLFRKNVKIVF